MRRIKDAIPWASAILNFALALLALTPELVSDVGYKWRISFAIVTSIIGLVYLRHLFHIRRQEQIDASNTADALLRAILSESVQAGNGRITLFRESVDKKTGDIGFKRIRRIATNPDVSPGGTEYIAAKESILIAASDLVLDDPLAHPVDERQSFPFERDDREGWLREQRKFVGGRAERLRMKSCSYAWRRIFVPTEVSDGAPHLLLIESTARQGIELESLQAWFIDSIIVEALRSLAKL